MSKKWIKLIFLFLLFLKRLDKILVNFFHAYVFLMEILFQYTVCIHFNIF